MRPLELRPQPSNPPSFGSGFLYGIKAAAIDASIFIAAVFLFLFTDTGALIGSAPSSLDSLPTITIDPHESPEILRRGYAAPELVMPNKALVIENAQEHGIDPALFAAQIYHESSGDPDAVGRAGEYGLGQLMPLIVNWCGISDPFDPEQNADCSARFMSMLMDKYGDRELALAAYNAGEPAVDACHCIPDNGITPGYVETILNYRHRLVIATEERVTDVGPIYPPDSGAVFTNRTLHGLAGYKGVDIHAGCGTPIIAPFDGGVALNGTDGYVGPYAKNGEENTMLTIVSSSGNTKMTLLHGSYSVRGNFERGEIIGHESNIGNVYGATGCHSHVIVYQDGTNRTHHYADNLIGQ